MSDPQHEVRSIQRLIEFEHLENRLAPHQSQSIKATMEWMLGYSKRRWWFVGYSAPPPPSRVEAILLGIIIVSIFSLLNTAINEIIITYGPRMGVPYLWSFMAYLSLAVPLSAISIANLAARLHLLNWSRA